MSTHSLRKAGGSVMVTVPPAYLKRTGLKAGSAVKIDTRGDKLVIRPPIHIMRGRLGRPRPAATRAAARAPAGLR